MRRAVGAVRQESPAVSAGNPGEGLSMRRKAGRVVVANGLDAADEDLVGAFDAFEANAPVVRQILLGRVEDL